MRALLPLALARPAAAQDRCWFICSEEVVLESAEAAARLEVWLGAPLPPGTVAENPFETRSQDSYVRARLETDVAGLRALLDASGPATDALKHAPRGPQAAGEPEWWDWPARKGVTTLQGSLPGQPFGTLSFHVASAVGEPGRWTVYA